MLIRNVALPLVCLKPQAVWVEGRGCAFVSTHSRDMIKFLTVVIAEGTAGHS